MEALENKKPLPKYLAPNSLEEIAFPEKLETIGVLAFYKCVNLKEIRIYKNLNNIGNSCFDGCSNVEFIVVGP